MNQTSRATVLCLSLLAASASQAEYRYLEIRAEQHNEEFCYRIDNPTRKPVEEVVLGASWDGHPLSTDLQIHVTDSRGWKASVEAKTRYGYQALVLRPQGAGRAVAEVDAVLSANGNRALREVAPLLQSGGGICISVTGTVAGDTMLSLPFKYSLRGDQGYTTGRVNGS